MRHTFSKATYALVTAFLAKIIDLNANVQAQLIPAAERGTGFKYDYCSMGLSVDVYNDAQNYMLDIFNGYQIPMDSYTCPFHPANLEYIRQA